MSRIQGPRGHRERGFLEGLTVQWTSQHPVWPQSVPFHGRTWRGLRVRAAGRGQPASRRRRAEALRVPPGPPEEESKLLVGRSSFSGQKAVRDRKRSLSDEARVCTWIWAPALPRRRLVTTVASSPAGSLRGGGWVRVLLGGGKSAGCCVQQRIGPTPAGCSHRDLRGTFRGLPAVGPPRRSGRLGAAGVAGLQVEGLRSGAVVRRPLSHWLQNPLLQIGEGRERGFPRWRSGYRRLPRSLRSTRDGVRPAHKSPTRPPRCLYPHVAWGKPRGRLGDPGLAGPSLQRQGADRRRRWRRYSHRQRGAAAKRPRDFPSRTTKLGAKTRVQPPSETPDALGITDAAKTEGRAVLAPGWEESGRSLPAGPQSPHREAPMVGLSF